MEIRRYLAQGKPLLFDGAMGTCYAALPGRAEARCERACLDHPEEVQAIHTAYLEAGSRAVKTNTFSVGVDRSQGDEALAGQLMEAACALAKAAAEPYGAYVFADLGPAPQLPGCPPAENYIWQADRFLAQGMECFLLETLPSDEGVAELAAHLKARRPEAFLLVSFAVQPDGVTREGHLGSDLYRRAAALPGVDAVGFNCVSGPHHMLRYIRGLELGEKPLAAMPNAGYPTVLGRRTVYQGRPDYFAGQAAQMVAAGAAIVGGCCGTSPAHIAALAEALKERRTTVPRARLSRSGGRERRPEESPLWQKLDAGRRVIAVELDPPADDDVTFFLDGVRTLRDAGADTVTIADCPIGRPRADSSLLACKIHRELGVEPLPHLNCRDRNLNATKALLLGLSMEGVRSVLLVTGDPIPSADRDEVKSVFNFNSRKLARYVTGLNENVFSAPFHVFGALNLNAHNFDKQLTLAEEKEANGMSGFLTQPVLSREALDNLKLARQRLKGKILGGIFPVVSHRNACFLNNEVSGIRVCDEIISLYEGKDREEGERLALTISVEIARAVEPWTDGVYLMTPFRRVELMRRLIEQIRGKE